MSKEKGKKVIIVFDKPILGDVTGNAAAFTSRGMRKDKVVVGPLIEVNSPVESISRGEPILYTEFYNTGISSGLEVVDGLLRLEEDR